MGFLGNLGLGGCNSSCDVLELVVIISVLSKLLKKGNNCCEDRCHSGGCFNIKLDLCTIAILFFLFGGFDKIFGGNKCC